MNRVSKFEVDLINKISRNFSIIKEKKHFSKMIRSAIENNKKESPVVFRKATSH